MYLTEVKIFHSGNRTICCRINRLHNMSKILNGLSSFAQHAGHILLFSELCARWISEFNITPPSCINYYKRQPWCLFHVNNRTVESSSRWISASSELLSSDAIVHKRIHTSLVYAVQVRAVTAVVPPTTFVQHCTCTWRHVVVLVSCAERASEMIRQWVT